MGPIPRLVLLLIPTRPAGLVMGFAVLGLTLPIFAQVTEKEESAPNGKSQSVGAFVIKEPAVVEGEKPGGASKPSGKVTVVCSKCQKEVSVDSEYGQKCPHCGIEWAVEIEIPSPPKPLMTQDSGSGSADSPWLSDDAPGGVPQRNPGQGAPARPAAGRDAAANPGGPVQLNVPPPPPVNGGVQEEMNLSNLPLWLKGALFIGAIGGLYYVLFYLR